jgi:hypothetical protein
MGTFSSKVAQEEEASNIRALFCKKQARQTFILFWRSSSCPFLGIHVSLPKPKKQKGKHRLNGKKLLISHVFNTSSYYSTHQNFFEKNK